MLDVQMTPLRKSSRSDMLRRYLKAVQRQLAAGAPAPQRFARFFEEETRPRKAAELPSDEIVLRRAS